MRAKSLYLAFSVLLMAILACNAPSGQATPDLAGTITSQALLLNASTGTPVDTPAASLSATPSVPEVSVTSNTNCRTGPSTMFDLVFSLNPGQTETLVGKDTADNYWIINNPSGGTCWLWGMYAVVSGNTSGLPEVPPPPMPTPKDTKTPKPTKTPEPPTATVLLPPFPPGNLSQSRTCNGGFRGVTPLWIEAITLTWQDKADNETGYQVYKDGSLIATLGPNSTQYNITLRYDQGTGGALYINFGVNSFNAGGSSTRTAVDVTTCP